MALAGRDDVSVRQWGMGVRYRATAPAMALVVAEVAHEGCRDRPLLRLKTDNKHAAIWSFRVCLDLRYGVSARPWHGTAHYAVLGFNRPHTGFGFTSLPPADLMTSQRGDGAFEITCPASLPS